MQNCTNWECYTGGLCGKIVQVESMSSFWKCVPVEFALVETVLGGDPLYFLVTSASSLCDFPFLIDIDTDIPFNYLFTSLWKSQEVVVWHTQMS